MESSIAVFLLRQSACELLPTIHLMLSRSWQIPERRNTHPQSSLARNSWRLP